MPQENQTDWIEWQGGECPLASGLKHEVRFRDGRIVKDDTPETWIWSHGDDYTDIVAFRIIPA